MLSLLSLGLPAGGKEQALAPRQLAYHEGSCPVGCEEVTSGPTIHGDPMFKVNGMGTRFMLPDGEPTELLRWTMPDGEAMALSGITFGTDSTSGSLDPLRVYVLRRVEKVAALLAAVIAALRAALAPSCVLAALAAP